MEKWIVEQWVEACADVPIKSFHPTAVAKATNLNLETIFRYLLELVQEGKLLLYWRVVCPNCFRECGMYEAKDVIPRVIDCMECGEQEVFPDMIFPVFAVAPQYKEFVKKKTSFSTKRCFSPETKGNILLPITDKSLSRFTKCVKEDGGTKVYLDLSGASINQMQVGISSCGPGIEESINQNLSSIQQHSPEIAQVIKEAIKVPELYSAVLNLTDLLNGYFQAQKEEEKNSKLSQIIKTLTIVKTTIEVIKDVAPVGKFLYNTIANYLNLPQIM